MPVLWRNDWGAGNGHLSGHGPALHFGLSEDSEIPVLEIRWPDGTLSLISGRSL
ncbi:MAG: ASPIC/UnbV domain-containing protein [Caldilineaceae bacterium]|nr:ASPIC/UnbV domain-containing protein [Caldilineaceae bacterium]